MADTFSETLVQSDVVMGEFNRCVSKACRDMNDVIIKHRGLITEVRELITKVEKILERDLFYGGNGEAETPKITQAR